MRMWSPSAKGGAASDAPARYLDTVGRPQIADHETTAGVDDDGVVATDVVVVENDVVVGSPADPGRPLQPVALSIPSPAARRRLTGPPACRCADRGQRRHASRSSAPVSCGVQGFLTQDALVQAAHRRTGVDAEVLGKVRFQSLIGVEGIGLPLSDVVGGDQLSPKPFAEGVFGAQYLQARR